MALKLSWYDDYNLEPDINQLKIKDYINKLSNKTEDKTIEIKINQIEKDYNNKLIEIEDLCSKPTEINNLKSKNSLIILQKELDIIKLITKYTLQNKNINYDFITNCLNILFELSETLRIRIGQKEFNHDKMQIVNDIYSKDFELFNYEKITNIYQNYLYILYTFRDTIKFWAESLEVNHSSKFQ